VVARRAAMAMPVRRAATTRSVRAPVGSGGAVRRSRLVVPAMIVRGDGVATGGRAAAVHPRGAAGPVPATTGATGDRTAGRIAVQAAGLRSVTAPVPTGAGPVPAADRRVVTTDGSVAASPARRAASATAAVDNDPHGTPGRTIVARRVTVRRAAAPWIRPTPRPWSAIAAIAVVTRPVAAARTTPVAVGGRRAGPPAPVGGARVVRRRPGRTVATAGRNGH
jgi:hypothetical protein